MCVELLTFIGNICKKYDLEYYIDGGNLLGAIRHEGFIPWDDDMDIVLMRNDYHKLHDVLHKEIKEHGLDDIIYVEYRPRKIDGIEFGSFIQVFVRHPTSDRKNPMLGGVDIFPFDFINEFNENTIEDEHDIAKVNFYRNRSQNVSYLDTVSKLYDELNLSMEKTDYIIPGVEGSIGKNNMYKFFILETDKIFPLKEVPFGDKKFPVPNDSDYYLRLIYKNYNNIPKHIHRHSRVHLFRYTSNADEVFNKCLNKLRNANDNF